jgi:hypothetical protein
MGSQEAKDHTVVGLRARSIEYEKSLAGRQESRHLQLKCQSLETHIKKKDRRILMPGHRLLRINMWFNDYMTDDSQVLADYVI